MLLRRLGCSSEKNKLFLVAQEVGRVIRTIYLLEWIANGTLRRPVRGTSHIQPKTSVKDFDLALIEWETQARCLASWQIGQRDSGHGLAGLLLDRRQFTRNLEIVPKPHNA